MKKIQKAWGLVYCTIVCNLSVFITIAIVFGTMHYISSCQYESLQEYKKSVATDCEIK